MKKKHWQSVMMFLFVLSLSSAAWAIDIMIEIPNGDFEDGTLSGHTLTGTGIGKVVNSSVVSTAGSPATGPTAFETAFPVFGNFSLLSQPVLRPLHLRRIHSGPRRVTFSKSTSVLTPRTGEVSLMTPCRGVLNLFHPMW